MFPFFKRKSLEYLEERENSRTFVSVIREVKLPLQVRRFLCLVVL